MKTMEERLEAAAASIRAYIKDSGDADNPGMFAAIALPVAFPELFDGTAWLAPMDADVAMVRAARDEGCPFGAGAFYAAMRRQHLTSTGQETRPSCLPAATLAARPHPALRGRAQDLDQTDARGRRCPWHHRSRLPRCVGLPYTKRLVWKLTPPSSSS
jgi:hypothetical protein